jgi:allophanate hydrolase subunit 2
MRDAVMEITLTGPVLEFHADTRVAISGADLSPEINGESVQLNTALNVLKGDVLSFSRALFGVRAYLAVAKGFLTDSEMESRSYFSPVTERSRIEKGDLIPYVDLEGIDHPVSASVKAEMTHFTNPLLLSTPGPEFDRLSELEQEKLFSNAYTVSRFNDRMAYQLEENFSNKLEPILTSAVLPGTVQLTPSGKLLLLMRDCQVTGGYPRILQLSEDAINILSQKKHGNSVQFNLDTT